MDAPGGFTDVGSLATAGLPFMNQLNLPPYIPPPPPPLPPLPGLLSTPSPMAVMIRRASGPPVVCPHLFAGCHGVCPNAHKQRPIYRKNSSKHIMALHRGCDCKYKSAMRIQEVLKEEEDDDAADSSSTAYMEDEQPQPQPPFQLLPQRQRQEASSSTPGDPLSQSPSPSAADDNGSMLDESGEADDDVKRPGPDKRRNSDIASPLMSPLKVEEVKEGDSLHRGGGGGGGVDAPSTPSTEPRTKKQRVVLVKNSSASVPRSQAKTERTVTISMKKWRSVELKVLTLEERLAQTIGVLDSFLTASRNGGSITATQQAQMHSQLMQTTSSAAASALASAAAAPHQEREEDSAQTTAYPPLRNLAHPLRPPPPPPPPASTSAPPPTAPPSSAPTAAPVPPPPNSLLPPPPPPLPPSSLPLHSSSTPSTIPQSLMPPHPPTSPESRQRPPSPWPTSARPTEFPASSSSSSSHSPAAARLQCRLRSPLAGHRRCQAVDADRRQRGRPAGRTCHWWGRRRAAHSAAAAQRPRHAADAAFASHATHSAAAAAAAEEVTDTSSQPRRRAREPSCRANQRWCDECVQAKRGELGSLSSAVSAEWVCVWWCAAYKWLVIHRMSARCVDAVRVVLYWLCRARLARW